jgi:hypothetical protein
MSCFSPIKCFHFRNVDKKVSTFSVPSPIKKVHQGVARSGMCPFLFGWFEGGGSPPHRQENFGLVRGLK